MTYKLAGYFDQYSKMPGEWCRALTLEHIDYSRNRWTDEDGVIDYSTGATDLLYTDFEVAFAGDNERIYNNSDYRVGLVYEFCTTVPDNVTFNPDKDYGAKSDETNLKAAIVAQSTSYDYKNNGTSARTIVVDDIDTSELTNKNRIQAALGLKNKCVNGKYTNANYLIKVTAYLIDKNNNNAVSLSNSVYTCLREPAGKDLFFTAP